MTIDRLVEFTVDGEDFDALESAAQEELRRVSGGNYMTFVKRIEAVPQARSSSGGVLVWTGHVSATLTRDSGDR